MIPSLSQCPLLSSLSRRQHRSIPSPLLRLSRLLLKLSLSRSPLLLSLSLSLSRRLPSPPRAVSRPLSCGPSC